MIIRYLYPEQQYIRLQRAVQKTRQDYASFCQVGVMNPKLPELSLIGIQEWNVPSSYNKPLNTSVYRV